MNVTVEPVDYGGEHHVYITMGGFRIAVAWATPQLHCGSATDDFKRKLFADSIPVFLQEWCKWKSQGESNAQT